jgi:radical SAM protein with 4Fe4S-binding SPASM domain
MPKLDIFGGDRGKKHIVMLTLTQDCNLRCRYCYEPHKSRDYYMSYDTAQQAIIEYMRTENEFDTVEFDFFGGEPLMAFSLIRDLVNWFHTKGWPKKHIFFISTNGTILSEEIKTWLVKNKGCVIVGLSLDGNKIAHDLNRSNSYDQVRANIPFFMEHWPNQPAKMTISAETIPYVADSIIELEGMNIPFSANIVFEDIWGSPAHKAELLEIYSQQLERLVDYYVAHPDLFPARIVDIRPEFILDEVASRRVGEDCVRWCGSGHEMITVEVDGSRSPCHRYSPWITGKAPPDISQVNRQKVWKPEKCTQCRALNLCPICAGYNWQENGDSSIRTTYHCDSFKLEFQASAKLQALRILQKKPEDLARLSPEEAYKTKVRLDALIEIAENGI